MLPANPRLLPGPTAKDPIFKDRSGRRRIRLRWLFLAATGLFALWLAVFVAMMLQPGPRRIVVEKHARGAPVAASPETPGSSFADRKAAFLASFDRSALQKADHGLGGLPLATPCVAPRQAPGSATADAPPAAPPPRVFAILPGQPVEAFLSLQRHCSKIDVLLPEWFEIGGNGLRLTRADIDPEMDQAVAAILADRSAAPLLMPVVNLAYDVPPERFAARLSDPGYRAVLAMGIAEAAETSGAVGACLRLQGMPASFAPLVARLLDDLRADLARDGRSLCLIASVDDRLWQSRALVRRVDHVVVTMFHEPWRGDLPAPLAAEPWLKTRLAEVVAAVGPEKLIVALGGHAVDWVSGRAVPERIGFAEAMVRIADARATARFAPEALNTHAAFADAQGARHQIWLLDAASASNSLRLLQEAGLTNVGFASLGEEDPALWSLFDPRDAPDLATRLRNTALPDYVSYSGTGPFFRFAAAAQPGLRTVRSDETTGMITGQTYDVLPQPARMERFGARSPMQIALTFDDGPNSVATGRILDVLREQDAPATFFVVGSAAISTPDILRRAVAEGHTIGSHTFFHPRMETLSPLHALSELNAVRNLIEGATGRSPLLYRAPYVRGPGPLNDQVAHGFELIGQEGYVVAGSDIVPPDWSGISADTIVAQVMHELATFGGNVIVLHDGRSEGMHTAEAVARLIPALRAQGYEIVPLPVLLGTTVDAMMPRVDWASGLFKGISFSVIAGALGLLILAFWVALFANFIRSVLYLVLAARREPGFVRPLRALPEVTVVVPAYNEELVIVQTVRTVLCSRYPRLKCIVVDDGSTDSTLRQLHDHFGHNPQVTILTQPNQGKWQALNAAYAVMKADIAVCLDADTQIAPDAILEIVQPFVDPKVGAVAGTVAVANRTNLLTRFQTLEYITAQQIARRAHEYLNGILVVPGALGAWRVDAVREVGLYSNETLTEDADLTIWMRRGGYRIAYAEAARAYTEVPADVRSLMKQRLRWSFGNLQTLWKHRGILLEFGPRRLFSTLDMILFGYLLPLVAPVMDVMFLGFAAHLMATWLAGGDIGTFGPSHYAVLLLIAVPLMDTFVAWIALRREPERRAGLLLVAPLMNFLYRPLLYISVYRAMWSALTGRIASWNKLRRLGFTGAARDARA